MAELKLNTSTNEIPDVEETNATTETNSQTFVKHEEATQRKLFANKKANIALGIAGGIIAFCIVAAIVFISI